MVVANDQHSRALLEPKVIAAADLKTMSSSYPRTEIGRQLPFESETDRYMNIYTSFTLSLDIKIESFHQSNTFITKI